MFDLERFRKAQDGHPGYAEAMRELRVGAKRSRWILVRVPTASRPRHVADGGPSRRRPFPAIGVVAYGAEEILRAAAALGYPRCAFTEEQIGAGPR